MANCPELPPPVFSYPSSKAPFAEFEAAVHSDPEYVKAMMEAQRFAPLKMTKGQWRFRSRFNHQVHRVREVKLAAKAALEEVIWRARLLPPFNKDRPSFLGFITLPGSRTFAMRTYMVLELAPNNFACVARCDGPLLGHAERLAFEENRDNYQDSFSPAVRRWMFDFGIYVNPSWDQPEKNTKVSNIIQDDLDESSLPMPVPAMLVETVMDVSSEDARSTDSTIALPGSPQVASPGTVAFQRALALVQAPLTPGPAPAMSASPMMDDTIRFIEE